jgi:hypothetical protein
MTGFMAPHHDDAQRRWTEQHRPTTSPPVGTRQQQNDAVERLDEGEEDNGVLGTEDNV